MSATLTRRSCSGREFGVHRVVRVRRADDGYVARLHAQWQYGPGYDRTHLRGAVVDGYPLDLAVGEAEVFTDISVAVEDGRLVLETARNRTA